MSGYDALLENYFAEEQYANDTFAGISSCLESLTAFVNEDVNFEATISLTEAENGTIKDKAATIGRAAKAGLDKLVEKIKAFVGKIREAVHRYVTKAKIVIAQGGNEAIKKIIANNDYKVGKDIKVKTISSNGKEGSTLTDYIYKEALASAGKIYISAANSAESLANGETEIKIDRDSQILDTLKEDITSSNVASDVTLAAADGITVKSVYPKYVGQYLDSVKKYLPAVESTIKDAQNNCNKIIKSLKKAKDGDKVNASAITEVSSIIGDLMKMSTYIVNYSMSILTLATKNSAKLALAAVDASGRHAAQAVKEAPGKAKEAIKDAKAKTNSAVKGAVDKANKSFANSDAGAKVNNAMLKAEEKLRK